jgi:hypothetical protein
VDGLSLHYEVLILQMFMILLYLKGTFFRKFALHYKQIILLSFFFFIFTVHPAIIKVLLATDAQENCFQRSIKIYIKITVAPTCFGV